MMRRRILGISLAACLAPTLAGCGQSESEKRNETADVAKSALSDASAHLQSLKGGKAESAADDPQPETRGDSAAGE